VAEGEELGSNLLQVLHRTPTELGAVDWVAGAPSSPPSGSKAAKRPFCPGGRPLASKIQAGCSATISKLWPLPHSADRRPLAQLLAYACVSPATCPGGKRRFSGARRLRLIGRADCAKVLIPTGRFDCAVVSPSGLSRTCRAKPRSEASYEPRPFHCS
jgi:hypothetical protein